MQDFEIVLIGFTGIFFAGLLLGRWYGLRIKKEDLRIHEMFNRPIHSLNEWSLNVKRFFTVQAENERWIIQKIYFECKDMTPATSITLLTKEGKVHLPCIRAKDLGYRTKLLILEIPICVNKFDKLALIDAPEESITLYGRVEREIFTQENK